jgi:hypothetical protein
VHPAPAAQGQPIPSYEDCMKLTLKLFTILLAAAALYFFTIAFFIE